MRISDWSSDVCSSDLAESAALIARMFAEAFSLTLGRSLAAREPPGPQAGPLAAATDPFAARAQLWIRDRFPQRFRLADLARDTGVSQQSLIRRFLPAGSSGSTEEHPYELKSLISNTTAE